MSHQELIKSRDAKLEELEKAMGTATSDLSKQLQEAKDTYKELENALEKAKVEHKEEM